MPTVCSILCNSRRFLLFFLCAVSFSFNAFSQSKTISELANAKIHDTQLYFYPSTLRMLNVNRDPAFYALIGDVEHLRILIFEADSILVARTGEMKKQLEAEGFEEAMSLRSNGASVHIYNKSPQDKMEGMVAFVAQEGQNFVIEVEGELNPMKVYNLFQNGVDIPVLDSYFKNQEEERQRGEKYQEFRKSLEEEESSKADSISNQDSTKP